MSKIYLERGKKIDDVKALVKERFNLDVDVEAIMYDISGVSDEVVLENNLKNAFDLEKKEKFYSLSQERDTLKAKIDEYKDKRQKEKEKEAKLKYLAEKKKRLEDMLSNVSDLIKLDNNLDKELIKFGELSQDKHISEKVSTIKYRRIEVILQALQTLKRPFSQPNQDALESHEEGNRNFYPIYLGGIIFQAVVTLGLIFVTDVILYRALLIGLFIANVVFYWAMSFFTAQQESIVTIQHSAPRLGYEDLIKEFDNEEDVFLVNAAWVNALRREKARVRKLIDMEFEEDEESLESLQEKLTMVEHEKAEWETLSASDIMSPQEYLKLRREFDIVEIELEDYEEAEQKIPCMIIAGVNKVPAGTAEWVYNKIQELVNKNILQHYLLLETE